MAAEQHPAEPAPPEASAAARSRLAALLDRAAGAYATVTAADAELRALAARRVAAERVLRAAGAEPGTIGAQSPLSEARRDLARLRDEFAQCLAARAEAVSALRRLTAECTAVRAELAGG